MKSEQQIKYAFAKVLKLQRIKRKLSQSELSERSELHRNAISLLERGKRMPNLETIIKIAYGLNSDTNNLVQEFLKELNKKN